MSAPWGHPVGRGRGYPSMTTTPRTRDLPEQSAHGVRSPASKLPRPPPLPPLTPRLPALFLKPLQQPTSLLLSLLPTPLLSTYCVWELSLSGALSPHHSISLPLTLPPHHPLGPPGLPPPAMATPRKAELGVGVCGWNVLGPLQNPDTQTLSRGGSGGNGYSCPDRPQGAALSQFSGRLGCRPTRTGAVRAAEGPPGSGGQCPDLLNGLLSLE